MKSKPNRNANANSYSEEHLVADILLLLPTYLQARGGKWLLKREVGVGRTIADLVAVAMPGESRTPIPSPLSIVESVVLSLLRRRGPTRIDLLEGRCGADRTGLRQGALRRLQDWGILVFERGGRVSLSASWSGPMQIIAIETKLTKWRVALRQAAQYKRYADLSYVVLPLEAAQRALRARTDFEEMGVGLLTLQGNAIVTLVEAQEIDDHDWRREFILSRLMNGMRLKANDAA